MIRYAGIVAGLLLIGGLQCKIEDSSEPDSSRNSPVAVPSWAEEAIWYQIFVERFRNGDPSNDPTLSDMKGASPKIEPDGWQTTSWTHDWYKPDEWAEKAELDFYRSAYLRRYGGDLQGVLGQLDYLQELGVTALYFNPINDSPSLHKYDARNYRHVDRNFGPDPKGDAELVALETPSDPSTWKWTAADELLLELIREVHMRGMRLILDYSWNHTGVTFWAWQDILENQAESDFSNWYEVERFDDTETSENEFSYRGWAGVRDMPELNKLGVPEGYESGPVEGNLHPDVISHVKAVTKRWLDPNGDGDPTDGIDGFRLDVADVVPLGFWRDYRQYVKSINPDAYLVGEVWWDHWPDKMRDPRPYLGDVFDAVMNYQWYMPTRSFFAESPPFLTPSSYVAHLDSIESGIPEDNLRVMMNLTASHDSPRFATSIYNPGLYKYHANPRENPNYKVGKPDVSTKRIQRLILIQQFTYYGAPHIWNGDEVGMWGADDPDDRKPLLWADLNYEDEAYLPDGSIRPSDAVQPDTEMFNLYRSLISVRKQHMDLFVLGDLRYSIVDDERGLLAYSRNYHEEQAVVIFNRSNREQRVSLPISLRDSYVDVLAPEISYGANTDSLIVVLDARDATILIRSH